MGNQPASARRFVDGIGALTPTVCQLMGTSVPASTACTALQPVVNAAAEAYGGQSAERCLIYCPDAIGNHLWQHPDLNFGAVRDAAPVKVPLRSVIPAKTPVCFASMFTGAPPEIHGIRRYERPVLTCDTLFDALLRAGKRVAIVAVKDSSIDLIFRRRKLDYFSEAYDPEVLARALRLVEADGHDVVLAYQQEYDDTLHRTTPLSAKCLRAAANHIRDFSRLADATREHWSGYRTSVVFAPDHGAHIDPATGHGDHGEDIPEDMELFHCYGFHVPSTTQHQS